MPLACGLSGSAPGAGGGSPDTLRASGIVGSAARRRRFPGNWRAGVSPDRLARLLQDPAEVAEVPPQEIPTLLGELERLKAVLWARMTSAAAENGRPEVPAEADRWVGPEEAAALLGLTPQQLSRRRKIPRKKIGHRTVRYSLAALKRYLARGT